MERLKFKITPSFWIFIIVATVFKQGYFATMYSFAMVLHEAAHYVAAKKLFYKCSEIKISIFGAVLYGDFQDVCAVDRIKIALAGPLCNLALCLVCLASWWLVPETYYFFEMFFVSNLSMACINLLPCYPLDGGRMLTGILDSHCENPVKITKVITVAVAYFGLIVFVMLLFSGNGIYGLGLFSIGLLSGALSKSGGECYVRSTFVNDRKSFLKHGMEKKILVFDENSSLRDVAKRMRGNFLYCLEVVDGELNVLCVYSASQLEKLVLEYPLDEKLKNLQANQ